MRSKQRSPRRLFSTVVYVLVPLTIVVILSVILTHSLQQNDSYGSVLSALAVIGTLIGDAILYLRRPEPPVLVEQEAGVLTQELLGQWEPEIKHRRQRFGDTRTIPLTWDQAGDEVADEPAAVVGTDIRLGTVRLKIDGQLDRNPDRAARQLARAFENIPSKRLVMLGEPGAGKTFLAITLIVGLLRQRTANVPVPVFLSLSSWDPVSDSLDEWIVRSLASDHFGGRKRTPEALLTARLILPVLDGLDELPEHLRRPAISRINDTLDGDRPLVLTCRSAEYRDGLAGGAPVLLRAPVVEIVPLTAVDMVAHLKDFPSWAEVVDHIQQRPDGPLATALTTPLMLSLFVAAYRDRDAGKILDRRYTSRHAVEDHLVDLLLDTVYPAHADQTSGHFSRSWTAQQARAWLTYLAQYLHRHDERDLAWWQLARRTLSPWVAPILGLTLGLLVFWLAAIFTPNIPVYANANDPVTIVLESPSLLGTIFGVTIASLWLTGDRRSPERATFAAGREYKGFGRGMATGILLVLIPGVPLLFGSLGVSSSPNYSDIVQLSSLAGALLALSLVCGLSVGLHELLVARSIRIGRASPEEFLRQDRRSALYAAVVTGIVVGVSSVLAASIAAAFAGHVGQRIASALGMPTVVDLHLPDLSTHVPWGLSRFSVPALLTVSVLLMALFALAVLTTRAWTRFLIARANLAITGHLPWRLMRFLTDARDKGLLRGAGGAYQFWHVRLQERLVATAVGKSPITRHQWARYMTFGLTAAVLALMVISIVSAEPEGCRATNLAGVDKRIERAVIDNDSGCFATLTPDEWRELDVGTSDLPTLSKIKSVQSLPYRTSDSLDVVGKLDQLDVSYWHRILQGVAAAQIIDKNPLFVNLVYTDVKSTASSSKDSLISLYLGFANIIDIDTNIGPPIGAGTSIIRPQGLNFNNLTDTYTKNMIDQWEVKPTRDYKFAPIDPTDGVDERECAAIGDASLSGRQEWTFDLRRTKVTGDLVNQIEHCGRAEILNHFHPGLDVLVGKVCRVGAG